MEKYVIWFLGANASGKSSLSANVQSKLRKVFHMSGIPPEANFINENNKILLTKTSRVSCNLGKFNHPLLYQDPIKTNACCGTDTLPKKELIKRSLEIAGWPGNNLNFIFVEGIMATRQWIDLFPQGYKILLVLLDIELDVCIMRLIARRSEKVGLEQSELLETLKDKTVENISGKISGFQRMFKDLSLRRDITSLYFKVEQDFDYELATTQILKIILT